MITIARDEEVVLEIRHHWYMLVVQSFFLFLFILVPFSISGFLSASNFLIDAKIVELFVFSAAMWFLLLWIGFFVIWTSYYLDVWIVTNKRVIAVEQRSLFSREISEFWLEKIQDVSVEMHGLIPTLLHFGNLRVQTASEARHFIIRNVPYPERAKEIIFKKHEEIMKRTTPSV